MARAEERLAALARDIGPRPACEEGEREAGDYIRDVFEAKDLPVEQQRIRSPRTYSFTYLLYFLAAVVVAVLSRVAPVYAALVGIVLAAALWFELDTRPILSRLMPKGNSRNIVARLHASQSGAATVVVICAHYDSARAALPFSPRMVGRFRLTFLLTVGSAWAICGLALVRAVVWAVQPAIPYVWYAMIPFAAYLLFPIALYVHREIAMTWVDGANDNASGVVAMLEVMERLTTSRPRSHASAPVFVGEEVGGPRPAVAGEPHAAGAGGAEAGDEDRSGADGGHPDGGAPWSGDSDPPDTGSDDDWGDVAFTEWLGVDHQWDVRREGQRLGDYSSIVEGAEGERAAGAVGAGATAAGETAPAALGEPDAFERFAGPVPRASTDIIEAPDLSFEPGAPDDAVEDEQPPPARGREPGLANKEVWFVATGCEEAGTIGMIEFLKRYGTRLRDAFFINIDNVGSGRLSFVSDEGMVRSRGADRRLLAVAREVADAKGFDMVAQPYHLLTTDATAALARGQRAMSVMAFDERGLLPNWHWATDTTERTRVENIEASADFVLELVKAL